MASLLSAYSDAALDQDARIASEYVDVHISSLTALNAPCSQGVQQYLQTARFLKFAKESLTAEIDRLSSALGKSEAVSSEVVERDELIIPRIASMEEFKNILPIAIKVHHLPVADPYFVGGSNLPISVIDPLLKQLQKDVTRDKFLINGKFLVGTDGSIDKLRTVMDDCLDQLVAETKLPLLTSSEKSEFASTVLHFASRTHCGGLAFSAAQHLVSEAGLVSHIIVPVSTAAPPIKIRFSIGSFNLTTGGSRRTSWGLRADIEAKSYYLLKCLDNELENAHHDHGDAEIDCIFSVTVGQEFNIRAPKVSKAVESLRSSQIHADRGSVLITNSVRCNDTC